MASPARSPQHIPMRASQCTFSPHAVIIPSAPSLSWPQAARTRVQHGGAGVATQVAPAPTSPQPRAQQLGTGSRSRTPAGAARPQIARGRRCAPPLAWIAAGKPSSPHPITPPPGPRTRPGGLPRTEASCREGPSQRMHAKDSAAPLGGRAAASHPPPPPPRGASPPRTVPPAAPPRPAPSAAMSTGSLDRVRRGARGTGRRRCLSTACSTGPAACRARRTSA